MAGTITVPFIAHAMVASIQPSSAQPHTIFESHLGLLIIIIQHCKA